MAAEAYRDINALIVGTGRVGDYHVRAQRLLGANVAAFDIDTKRVHDFQKTHGTQTVGTLEEGVDWASIVHICTPDDQHTDIAIRAMASGKDVLCEKPLATSLADARTMQQAATESNGNFFVGHNIIFEHPFRAIREKIQRGDTGRLSSIYAEYVHDYRKVLQETPWRVHQNYLYGGAVHPIVLVQHIVGEPVVSVHAVASIVKLLPTYTPPEDYQITLRFASGLLAQVYANNNTLLPVHRVALSVRGEHATIEGNNKVSKIRVFTESDQDFVDEESPTANEYKGTIDREVQLIDDYHLGISDLHAPVPTIDEAMPTMYVLDAIEQSIQERREVEVNYHPE